jgi:hypothetical protein
MTRLPPWWTAHRFSVKPPPQGTWATRIASAAPVAFAGAVMWDLADTILSPPMTALTYQAWKARPIKLPSPDALMDCYNRGILSAEGYVNAANCLGIDADPGLQFPAPIDFNSIWELVRRSRLHVPGPEFWMDMAIRGGIDITANDGALRDALNRSGASIDHYLPYLDYFRMYPDLELATRALNWGVIDGKEWNRLAKRAGADPDYWRVFRHFFYDRPSTHEALLAYAHKRIDKATMEFYVKANGDVVGDWLPIIPAMQARLNVSDALTLRNRRLISNTDVFDYMELNGLTNDEDQIAAMKLRETLPTTLELANFSAHRLLDIAAGSWMGLFDDIPQDYERLMELNGRIGLSGYFGDKNGVRSILSWGDIEYAAHRRIPTIGEGAAAYHRLREDSIDEIRAQNPDCPVFDRDRFHELMLMHGIPRNVVPMIEEITFAPLSLREIRIAVRLGIRDREWFVARFQDQGHRKDRAEDLADILYAQEEYRRLAPIRNLEQGLLRTVQRETLAPV